MVTTDICSHLYLHSEVVVFMLSKPSNCDFLLNPYEFENFFRGIVGNTCVTGIVLYRSYMYFKYNPDVSYYECLAFL